MTPLWIAEALQQATNGEAKNPFAATGVSIDTRTLQPGDLFIALRAESDGHAPRPSRTRQGRRRRHGRQPVPTSPNPPPSSW